MSKKQAGFVIIISVLLGFILNIFAGRFLAAEISTWPLLNQWHILSPETPIVITNRETVTVSSVDVSQTASAIKSKISTLVMVNASTTSVMGAVINLTSDGNFVTLAGNFSKNGGNYYVVLNDGRTATVTAEAIDPATSLEFFKANLSSVPVANIGDSSSLAAGQEIILAANSLENFSSRVNTGIVNFPENDMSGQVFQSDYPRRAFGLSLNSNFSGNQVVVDTSGNIVGFYSNGSVISSDVLKHAMSLYFLNNQQILRPAFGFSYGLITAAEAQLTNQPQGAAVKDVSANSPGHSAGLMSGDIITSVDGQPINETSSLEGMLEKYNPGSKLQLTVARKDQALNLSLTAGELK